MEAVVSSETLVASYQTKQDHVSQDNNLYSDHNENIKSDMFRIFKLSRRYEILKLKKARPEILYAEGIWCYNIIFLRVTTKEIYAVPATAT
jgi:hypothetical protein